MYESSREWSGKGKRLILKQTDVICVGLIEMKLQGSHFDDRSNCTLLIPGKREPNRCRDKKKNTLKKSRFTPYQTKTLETAYQVSSYLTKEAYQALAETVDLNIAQVRTWFNNRRKLRTHGKPREKTVKPGLSLLFNL